MSGGLHRLWKAFAVALAAVRAGERVLDVAAGSGDLALDFAKASGTSGEVWLTDINRGDAGAGVAIACSTRRPGPRGAVRRARAAVSSDYFDCVSIAFGCAT